jgi:hypothetical protein
MVHRLSLFAVRVRIKAKKLVLRRPTVEINIPIGS